MLVLLKLTLCCVCCSIFLEADSNVIANRVSLRASDGSALGRSDTPMSMSAALTRTLLK